MIEVPDVPKRLIWCSHCRDGHETPACTRSSCRHRPTYRCRRCQVALGILPHAYCRGCVEELLEEAAQDRPAHPRENQ